MLSQCSRLASFAIQTPLAGFKVGDLLRVIQSSGLSSKCGPYPCLALTLLLQLCHPSHRYFFLPGSLTTPPCTQGVSWVVSAEDLTISNQALAALQVAPPQRARIVLFLIPFAADRRRKFKNPPATAQARGPQELRLDSEQTVPRTAFSNLQNRWNQPLFWIEAQNSRELCNWGECSRTRGGCKNHCVSYAAAQSSLLSTR